MEYVDDLYAGFCALIRSLVWSNTAMTMLKHLKDPVAAAQKRAKKLENAAVELSWSGSQEPELRPMIEQAYVDADIHLRAAFDEIRRRMAADRVEIQKLKNELAKVKRGH